MYETPTVLATYSARELAEEAATCRKGYEPNFSDGALKRDVELLERPLDVLRGR